MYRKYNLLIAIILFLILIIIFKSNIFCEKYNSYKLVELNQALVNDIKNNKYNLVLDVRTRDEYLLENLASVLNQTNTDYINFPLDHLADITLNKYKNKTILIICRSGRRAEIGAKIFLKKCYSNLNVVKGGGVTELLVKFS